VLLANTLAVSEGASRCGERLPTAQSTPAFLRIETKLLLRTACASPRGADAAAGDGKDLPANMLKTGWREVCQLSKKAESGKRFTTEKPYNIVGSIL
jgi:hypothetical protein